MGDPRAPRETRYPPETSRVRRQQKTETAVVAAQARTSARAQTAYDLRRLVCINGPCPCGLRRVKGVLCPQQHSASCSVRCAVSRTDATCQAIRAQSTSGLDEATSRKAMRPTAQAAAAGERSADAPALCRKLLTAAAVTHQNVTRHSQRRASSRLVCLLLQSISNISLGEFLH